MLHEVFETENYDKKVGILDQFFQNQYVGFKEELLKQAVALLFESQGNISVITLAKSIKVHPKTLYRLFKKHLCCSISDYRSLIKFRNALNNYYAYDKKPKLIELKLLLLLSFS